MATSPPTSDHRTTRRTTTGTRGSHSTGRKRSALGWLPWAALALLALLIAATILIVRNVGDEGDGAGVDLTDDPAAGDGSGTAGEGGAPAGSPTGATVTTVAAGGPAPQGGATSTSAAAPAGGAPAGAGTLTAGEQPLLPLPAQSLAELRDQQVTGNGVNVESVVADEGFWVGNDPTNRVFVHLSPEARTTEGESPFQVQAGQRINLTGTLAALTGAPGDLGVEADGGADQLVQQGHFIEAANVTLT